MDSSDDGERVVFCFGVNGERDGYYGNYHPASLYREGADNPYRDAAEDAERAMRKAFKALPKPPEDYDRSDAGLGGWVRFDFEGLLSGENTEPIQVTDE